MPMPYVTLWQLRQSLGIGADDTHDDALLSGLLLKGTRWLDRNSHFHFDPRLEVHYFDTPARSWTLSNWSGWNSKTGKAQSLLFDDDLLTLVTFTNGDATLISSSNYVLEPYNTWPKYKMNLVETSGAYFAPSLVGNFQRALQALGVWGYHNHYDQAWANSLDTVLDNPLLVGATAMTVSDADGPAGDSDEPRFQVGNLIRFSATENSEYALVTGVDYSTNIVTLLRGQNGTTAAAQAAGTALYVFRPIYEAQAGLVRLATWLYRLKDVTFFERVSILGTSSKVAPGAIPADVLELLPHRVVTA